MTISDLQKKISAWASMEEGLRILKDKGKSHSVYGVSGGVQAFFIGEYARRFNRLPVIVVPDERDAEAVQNNLELYQLSSVVIPHWGSIAYRALSPSAPVFSERAQLLSTAAHASEERVVYIIPERALLTPVPPLEYVRTLSVNVCVGNTVSITELAKRLVEWGYLRVPRVTVRGEFAVRGGVLDVFTGVKTSDHSHAYRIQFDFDLVEKIKIFNTGSQQSVEEVSELALHPMKEVIWDEQRIETLQRNFAQYAEFSDESEKIIAHLNERGSFEGEEIFYPLSFEKPSTLLEYFADRVVFFIDFERQKNADDVLSREYASLYKRTKATLDEHQKHTMAVTEYPAFRRILLSFEDILSQCSSAVYFKNLQDELSHEKGVHLTVDPPRSFFGNIVYLKEELTSLIENGWSVFVFAESEQQSLRLKEVFHDIDVTVFAKNISTGFGIPDLKILVLHEHEIFDRKRRIPKSIHRAKSRVIDSFIELNPEDFVVHVQYGIGQFKGIERVTVLGNERDYINLLYANEETVFIPIEQADLVQRYIGNEGEAPRLDILGSKAWENRKNKVKKSVEDIAEKLIELYSRRKAARGFAFQEDDEWQAAFEAAFPYEETDDQLTCIQDVKQDMQKPEPMDRLICGDVGYGKTEVAMRAAFKAVMGGKQAAFLAPTTILVEQHFETLYKRFKQFPVRVERLSRFVSKKDQKKVLQKLAHGEIDIIVGTHRIIQKDVVFKDLGLMIIDEEQRFGVKDKEKLKHLKTNVDCLALSATPIPRTLHISLLKIRDMSIIETPPQNRRPVETYIAEFNPEIVARAVRAETARGGQVFYLHNRIESLEDTRVLLERTVPEMLVGMAHGRMTGDELEAVFRRFNAGGFHVLLATTIIENGIDIPNANTIIIDRADMYGVSQLYQLRGRVGRSDKKAYAYLLHPKEKALSEIAMKRLQVISDFTELGSGFKIAMKDMEIRGAGNLLGKEQSGEIYSVGFDLYLRLLEEAVQRLQNSDFEPETETVVELDYTGFIPDTYISAPQTKMEVYKKIAGVKTSGDLDAIHTELIDRFGKLPEEVESLLSLSEIKILCKRLFVESLKERNGNVFVAFSRVSKISVDKILRLIHESRGTTALDPLHPNVIILKAGKIGLKQKSEFIREKLEQLS